MVKYSAFPLIKLVPSSKVAISLMSLSCLINSLNFSGKILVIALFLIAWNWGYFKNNQFTVWKTLAKHIISFEQIILLVSVYMFGFVKVQSGDRNHSMVIFNREHLL